MVELAGLSSQTILLLHAGMRSKSMPSREKKLMANGNSTVRSSLLCQRGRSVGTPRHQANRNHRARAQKVGSVLMKRLAILLWIEGSAGHGYVAASRVIPRPGL